jgi:hypothetical protein
VVRLDVLVIAPDGQRLRVCQRLLESARQFVHAHGLEVSALGQGLEILTH